MIITATQKQLRLRRFEDLLPASPDPKKDALRESAIAWLNAKGEILPAADSSLGKAWKLVHSDRSSLDDCEEVIRLDPALTARIFHVANSAAYHAQAADISEAVRFIGFKVLREIVLNLSVMAQFSSMRMPAAWNIFWLRNIFVARMTERIASLYIPTTGAEYLAGLTHDIGWLFMASYFPDEFTKIYDSPLPIVKAEMEVMPFSHANLAAAVALRSSLPMASVDAVLHHHKQVLMTQSTAVEPSHNPLFLGVVLGVCDRAADACQLDLFERPCPNIDQVAKSPEVTWLRSYRGGTGLDLIAVAAEELEKANELFNAFFSEPLAAAA
jgi:HD-like signal output (HDOD) protein